MEDYKIPSTQNQLDHPNVAGTPNPNKPKSKGNGKKVGIIVVVLLLLIAAGAGAAWLLADKDNSSDTSKVSPVPTKITMPTSTPTPSIREVAREEVTVEILNGTGVPGEASKLQTELEDLGYESFEVGNADKTDYDATEVVFATDLPENIVEEITELLEEMYESVKSTKESGSSFDVSIITGTRTGSVNAVTSTPLPTKTLSGTITPKPSVTVTVTPTPSN